MKKVFVYGTLKRGGRFSPALKNAKFLGEKTIKGFEMFDLGAYPALSVGPPTSEVKGEVYEIDAEMEKLLDRIEGYPFLYQKINIDKDFFLYYIADKNQLKRYNRIEEGIWKN